MGVNSISELQRERQEYVNRITSNHSKVKSYEYSYESLKSFKVIVERSQGAFHSINAGRSAILTEVETVMQNSRTAQKYHTGMKNILSGIGFSIIGVVYSALLGTVSNKLKNYMDSINDCDDDILYCESKIRDIDLQIRDAEKQVLLANSMTGGV